MDSRTQEISEFPLVMLLLQLIFCISVFFDVLVVRQVLGFVCLTLFPGFIIIRLLKIDGLDNMEILFFSVGLSIAFLMLAGVFTNQISFIFSISDPLSPFPLFLAVNGFVLLGSILIIVMNLRNEGNKFSIPEIPKQLYLCVILLSLIIMIVLCVIGAIWLRIYGISLILLIGIMLISLLFVIASTFRRISLQRIYPIILLAFALSLLYYGSLVSSYPTPYNSDLARELFIFKNTLYNKRWDLSNSFGDMRYGRVQSMLSVTVLPTMYSNLLDMEPDWVIKILFPTIFSFVPVGLFLLWKERFGNKSAFISTFLFLSNATFYTEMLGLNRQMIAEVFFILLLFIVLSNKLKSGKKMMCFFIVSFALVVSHYAVAEIFLFFISISWILSIISKNSCKKITLNMTVLFFVIMFSWYIYTTRASAFESFVSYGDYVYRSLSDIFNPEARQPEVLRGLGLEPSPTFWNALSRGFAYMTEFLMVLGFVSLVTKKVHLKNNLDREFFMFIIVAIAFLGLLIIVPGLPLTMNMTRFYHILLFFIAPLSVVGADFIVSLRKKNSGLLVSVILIAILVPYFLFQTGFVYEIVGNDSWAPLSIYRMPAYRSRGLLGIIDEMDIFSAQWLRISLEVQRTTVYGDYSSVSYALFAYSMIIKDDMIVLSNVTTITDNSVIYLSRLNTIDNLMVGEKFMWNTSDFPFLDDLSFVYTNGASEICKK